MPQRLSDDDTPYSVAGFGRTGTVADLDEFRTSVVRQLHSEFLGHAVTENWFITFAPVNSGVEALVLLPQEAVTVQAVEHLVAIMAHHMLLPLPAPELDDAVDRMKKRVNTIFRGDSPRLARAAAKWWADRFSERMPAKKTGVVAVDSAAALIPTDRPTATQVRAFQESLEKSITAQLESEGSSYIRMDYDADHALSAALQAAGLQENAAVIYLPWKTTTHIRDGQFTTTGG